MKIACLGWGSLVWDPRDLPIKGKWHEDGPILPIEFARQSSDGRITLVIVRELTIPKVPSLWAFLDVETIDDAVKRLRQREGIPSKNENKHIGRWLKRDGIQVDDSIVAIIGKWALDKGLEGVVWTDLPPKFKGKSGYMPSIDEVITYINELSEDAKERAQQYIQMTPLQVDTPYRKAIEKRLGWKPIIK